MAETRSTTRSQQSDAGVRHRDVRWFLSAFISPHTPAPHASPLRLHPLYFSGPACCKDPRGSRGMAAPSLLWHHIGKGALEGAKLFALRGSAPIPPHPPLLPLEAAREREVIRTSRFAQRKGRSWEPLIGMTAYAAFLKLTLGTDDLVWLAPFVARESTRAGKLRVTMLYSASVTVLVALAAVIALVPADDCSGCLPGRGV
ncbi:unnamed protein product [Prorocentrum cordatum]|uniref:Uncharacterized protein n=1 Tax=Prorocentrum cordatum TaxID=2364126 RepID=A0ABN9U5K4_9DINO|nr:unnamed protein product [Polarella glacialis]